MLNDYERAALFLITVLLAIAVLTSLAQLGHSQTFPKHWGQFPKKHQPVLIHRLAPKVTARTWKMARMPK